ncbi:hypothetical protein DQ04_05801000 [Trypanosoma grayi]|uniref:hypothetical protein n=1 Tax=Trypanosoma grayi TaxID=71804 RepID=UPI0004F40845|nr:hypothetical protein DQ04_05801000 [Trypanosoma grayi]KEG09107.1 hypothetical protein DQ04_05801000 [Trypanosoma grayi]
MFSFPTAPFTPLRAAAVLPVLLLLLLIAANGAQAYITGAVSWASTEGSTAADRTFSAPLFATDGTVLLYAEMVPSSATFRLRNVTGLVIQESTYDPFAECASPTGVTLYNQGPRVFIFCGDGQLFFDVVLDTTSGAVHAERYTTEETFYPSETPHPTPLLLARRPNAGLQVDAALVVSRRGREYCIGRYVPKEHFIVCQAEPIADFYLATWAAAASAEELDPNTYLITESKVPTGLRLDNYYLPTFASGVRPNATSTLTLEDSSGVMHTNVNDANGSAPLIAYVQAGVSETLRVTIAVVNVYTLEFVKSGSVNSEIAVETRSPVSSAYMVANENSYAVVVQTSDVLMVIDYNGLPEVVTPKWALHLRTVPEVIFSPLRDLSASADEWHRRQGSPSYTDYNPYHTIQATSLTVVQASSNMTTYALSSGSVSGSMGEIWSDASAPFCNINDRIAVITAFEDNLVYVGCTASGHYTLIDLLQGSLSYFIKWPTVYPSVMASFGYINRIGSVTLSNGTNARGIDLNPLLLFSESVLSQRRQQPAGAYYQGQVAMLTEVDESPQEMMFSYYVHSTRGTDGGRTPMPRKTGPTKLPRNVTSAAPFTVFFGDRKRYIATATTAGILTVFQASDGSKVSDLNLSMCIKDPTHPEVDTVAFMNSLQHFGSYTDYYVVLGGTSTCIFEVNDTLIPRMTQFQRNTQGATFGTTTYSGYRYTTATRELAAFSSFFDTTSTNVYSVAGLDAYVVGSNVFVYIKDGTITCRSVRSDITVWTQALPTGYQAPIVHMSYYNNTVFVVDQQKIYRYDVQYREVDNGASRVLFQATVGAPGMSIQGSTVGQGIVVVYTITALYAYDAATGQRMWQRTPRTTQSFSGGKTEVVVYAPEDAGGSSTSETGPAYIEVRVNTPGRESMRLVDVYTQFSGSALTSVSEVPNDLTGPVIWGNRYVTFSAGGAGGMVAFRALNLPNVTIPEQAKRVATPTTDVFVPGENPIVPVPPVLPRGDDMAAGAPPMIFSLIGDAALVSEDRTHAVVGINLRKGETTEYTVRCVNVNDPQGSPRREWALRPGTSLSSAKFLGISNTHFAIFTTTQFQFYAWSNCQEIGSLQVLSKPNNGFPPYITRGDKNQWIFLNGEDVIAMDASSGNQVWQTTVGKCSTIRLVGGSVICDGGSAVAVINADSGGVMFQDAAAGAIALAGSNFAGVAVTARGYSAVYYSTSGKVFEAEVGIPGNAGNVVAAISGRSATNVVVFFDGLVASVTFSPDTSSAKVDWTNDLNGESPQLGAAGYVAAANANIAVGTSNGIVMLDASTGQPFANISLQIRFQKDAGEVQMMKILPVTSNSVYAFMWNGYITLINSTPGEASTVFAFGSGVKRASQLSLVDRYLLISSGASAGIVPLGTSYWGAPVSEAAMTRGNTGIFIAGRDQTNTTGVNLAAVTSTGRKFTRHVPREVQILSSMPTGKFVVFFGNRSISSIGDAEGSGMDFALPASCLGAELKYASRGEAVGGSSVVWYGDSTHSCIFIVDQKGAPPTLLTTFTEVYTGMANVRYGNSFALISPMGISFIGHDGYLIGFVPKDRATYISSLSSPDTGQGIVVTVDRGNGINCFQVEEMLHVWNYTLSATSSAPITYYNDSIFVSTEKGPYHLSLKEFTYPCPDRALLFLSREPVVGRTTYHSQVVVNEVYTMAYVTTYQTFYAFDTFTGEVLWQRPDLYGVKHAVVLRNGMLLAASSETSGVVFLNPFTGETLLTFAGSGFGSSAAVFTSPNDMGTVAFGDAIATVLDIANYDSYFNGVKPNRPVNTNTPPYRPYSYSKNDRPNDCSAPSSAGMPLYPQIGLEWVSGSHYGLAGAAQTFIDIPPGHESGWAASLGTQTVYIARVTKGIFEQTARVRLDERGCNMLNLFASSAEKVIVGIRCNDKTLFFNASGVLQGNGTRFAKSSHSAVIRDYGFFMNDKNYFDGISLSTFNMVPNSANTVKCESGYNMVAVPKEERIILFCDDVGIRSVQYSTLSQIGGIATAGPGLTTFTTYDVDEASNLGIACGQGGPGLYMVVFRLNNASVIMTHNETIRGKPLCGIRYPDNTNITSPLFVLAYPDGFKTWSLTGGPPRETQNIGNSIPAAITSNGVIYRNKAYDYYFRGFGGSASRLVKEAAGEVTGHMIVRGTDGFKATSVAIVYGREFSFALDTSMADPRPLWSGGGGIQYNPNARYVSSIPYVYTTTDTQAFVGLMARNVSFSVEGTFRMSSSLVDGEQRAFFAQPGTIGCVSSSGNVLWNVGFSNSGRPPIPFSPVVMENLDYGLASGGGRTAVIFNKRTGAIAMSFLLDTCRFSADVNDAQVFTNGTLVYITIMRWSCMHIVDINVKNETGVPSITPVTTLEVSGLAEGMREGFPIWAKVERADHIVFAAETPNTDGRNQTFVVYRIDNARTSSWTLLWRASLRVDMGRTSTYGYFIYTSVESILNVYDLLTGRYVWGYIFDTSITAPVVGADRTLYVLTVGGVQSLRSYLNTAWSLRLMGNTSVPSMMLGDRSAPLGPLRTPYGQILFSSIVNTIAFTHEREAASLKLGWVAEKPISRLNMMPLAGNTVVGLFDSGIGSGALDLSSGLMLWFSGEYSATPINNGVFIPNAPLFACSFVRESPTCRLVPLELLQPRTKLPLYLYDAEPLEKTPSDWVPIYPGGGGNKPMRPTPRCVSLMYSLLPPFANCVVEVIAKTYPQGRDTPLSCPDVFYPFLKCMESLTLLGDSCVDVATYMSVDWKRQTSDPLSPVGVCDATESQYRCNTTDGEVLAKTCQLMSLPFLPSGYENPVGYDLGYELPVFQFPSPPVSSKSNALVIAMVIVAVVVVVAVAAGVGVYCYRRRKKRRDARFFDDDDNQSAALLKHDNDEEPMTSFSPRSHAASSMISSLDVDGVAPRAPPPPVQEDDSFSEVSAVAPAATTTATAGAGAGAASVPAAAAAPAAARPKKMPPKMPTKVPGKMMAKKGFGPKVPPPAAGASTNPNLAIVDDI